MQNVEDMLASLLGADKSVQDLKRMLIERTEGNPLFLEESIRTLAETRMLIGERGAYRHRRESTRREPHSRTHRRVGKA